MEASNKQQLETIEQPINPEAESKEPIVDANTNNNLEHIEKPIEDQVCQNENSSEAQSENNLNSNLNNCAIAESIIAQDVLIQSKNSKKEVEPIDTHKLYSNIVAIRSSGILDTKEDGELGSNKESKGVLCSEHIGDQGLLDYIKDTSSIGNSTLSNEKKSTPIGNSGGSSYDLK